jgi:hypothetical protein
MPVDARAEVGRVRTALLASLAGLIAAVGAVLSGLTYRLNNRVATQTQDRDLQGQITERFTRAIDQLGSEKLDVRLGGIYGLERIARDSASDQPQVVEVLTAFVREHARWEARSVEVVDEARRPATDVQAILTVLGRRRKAGQDAPLDFRLTDLRGADLSYGHFENALFDYASLAGARFDRAALRRAIFYRADLKRARLWEADLKEAVLIETDLSGASLNEADLRGAQLVLAVISERTILALAMFDTATTPPSPDFDFRTHGARKVE